jgi:hypothetical protein
MLFRLKALGLHVLASLTAITLLLGLLYAGWYRWPGWYLADAGHVVLVLACVDLVAGPLLTFVIASPHKPKRVLARDVGVIAFVQLTALAYGALQLWNGRPLYYAFSEDVLQLVQAYDVDPDELALARRQHAPLVPHWYDTPRWIWAPLPQDAAVRDKIVSSAVAGGTDVIAMPKYYQPWEAGLATLPSHWKKIDELNYFSGNERKRLKARVAAAGLATNQANAMAMLGRGRPLLVLFDPSTRKLLRYFRCD